MSFIIRYRARHGGNSPSYTQIMRGCGLSSTSVAWRIVKDLIDDGRLYKVDNRLCVRERP